MNPVYVQDQYKENFSTRHLTPAQYSDLAQKAARYLGWTVVSANEHGVRYITYNPAQPETITLSITGKEANLSIASANEYYHDPAISRENARRFGVVMDQLITAYDKADRNLHPMNREKWGALIPSKSYLITPLLAYANAAVFLAMILAGLSPLHPLAKDLFIWGGTFSPAVHSGQWWRLFTYMFLHGGIAHLAGNLFALLYIGMFLEPLTGRFRFISAYLLTGIFAGLTSMAFHPGSVGVGASGAIFGMYGMFLSMLTTSHIQKTQRKTMLRSLLFFIVYNLMMGLQGNTDNAAHIGGLLSGIAIGFVYYPGIAKHAPLSKQILLTVAIALCTGGITWACIKFF